ncbi:uncharacterized protein B0T23DRAFT_404641 [Neurospora hispaniola]|uniref:Uncharacterized protein n=1 Tax=Neurospora hispaniola TaxID=588809 RepID=A0AAJ0I840_9PEZI|nr:hypothetical protein B0T23DRAFT_404641 [Neurospora hispaniola]
MTNKGRQEERPSGHRITGQKCKVSEQCGNPHCTITKINDRRTTTVGAFVNSSPDEKNGTSEDSRIQYTPLYNTAPSLGSEMKSFTRTATGFYGYSEDELLHRFSFTCDTLPTRMAEFEEAVFQNTCSLYAFRTLAAYSARFACFRL